MCNQILLLLPKGQCIQALPKQNDNQTKYIENDEEIRKIISKLKNQPKTNTRFSQGIQTGETHSKDLGISISDKDYTCINNRPVPKDIPNCDMVKTNETHTSNGGLFCTFRNIKKGKLIKAKAKKKKTGTIVH